MTAGPYYDGRVHVLSERCTSCVFRPGNLMSLSPGRLKELCQENVDADAALTCHQTIYTDDVRPAVCRGFYDAYSTTPLRLARVMGVIKEVPPPK